MEATLTSRLSRGEVARKLVHMGVGGIAFLLRFLGPLWAAACALGAVLFNLLLLGVAVLVLYTESAELVPALKSYWLWIHVSAAIIASAVCTVGSLASVLCLFAERYERRAAAGSAGGVRDAVGERLQGAGRGRQPLFLEFLHLVDEPLAFVADAVAVRHPHAMWNSSSALCGRRFGSFCRQASTRSSSSRGIGSSVRCDGGTGCACTCCISIFIGVSASNTRCPVSR